MLTSTIKEKHSGWRDNICKESVKCSSNKENKEMLPNGKRCRQLEKHGSNRNKICQVKQKVLQVRSKRVI